MTFFKQAMRIFFCMIIFAYAGISTALDCNNIISLIENKKIKRAAHAVQKAPSLCAFYVAQAFVDKGELDKAHSHIARIRNVLDPREPFYYKALYLKLLLLEDLNESEINQGLRQLKDGEPALANQLPIYRTKQFKEQFQKLLQAPFNTQIDLDSPWIADLPEKKRAEEILALVADIRERDATTSTQKNSQTILDKFKQLTKAGATVSTHEILVRHTDYVQYYTLMAQARNEKNDLIVRLDHAQKALAILEKYNFPLEDAKKLVAQLEQLKEIETLSRQLSTLKQTVKSGFPTDAQLNQLSVYWTQPAKAKQAIVKHLKSDDKNFLEILKLYRHCHQRQFGACNQLLKRKNSDISGLLIDYAKQILKENVTSVADHIEAIIKNVVEGQRYTLKTAYNKASALLEKHKQALQEGLPNNGYQTLLNKIQTLKNIESMLNQSEIESMLNQSEKDWTAIWELSESLQITYNFTELDYVPPCHTDQKHIDENLIYFKGDDFEKAIQKCHSVLQTVSCPGNQMQSKLIRVVANKFTEKTVQFLNNPNNQFQVVINYAEKGFNALLADKFDKKLIPAFFEADNKCRAQPPLEKQIINTRDFFKRLRYGGEPKGNKRFLRQVLKDYSEKGGHLINVDAHLDILVRAVSVQTTRSGTVQNTQKQNNTETKQTLTPQTPPTESDNRSNFSRSDCTYSSYGWEWKESTFRYMLSGKKFRKDYNSLKNASQTYTYFAVGMEIWTGQKSSMDYYQTQPSYFYDLAKAVEALKEGLEGDNCTAHELASSHLRRFHRKVQTSAPNARAKRGSRYHRAYFADSFFTGLNYLERQQYQESYCVIHKAYKKYKYTNQMNNFAKSLMGAIVYLGELGQNPKANCRGE